jgi:hypothetical protein
MRFRTFYQNTLCSLVEWTVRRTSKEIYLIHYFSQRKLIFAFSSDLDIHVDAVDLLNYMDCHSHTPNTYYTSLTDDFQICETLLYFFTHGVGSEIFVSDRGEFNKMLKVV